MLALLLFAILVVLLIATGLMPGLLRAIGGFLALVVLISIFVAVGPAYGFGAIVLVVFAFVGLYVWEDARINRQLESYQTPPDHRR